MKKVPLKFGIMITAVALAAGLAGAWLAATSRENDSRAMLLPDRVMTVFPNPKPLAAFRLVDHRNREFDPTQLRGKWTFLFFGFTHCPDICPTTMALLARVRENIARSAGGAEDVQVVFVSVDPNRDAAENLRQYVSHFDQNFVGATGADSQLRSLADQLGATYEVAYKQDAENYPVYHSAEIFLLDPEARFHAVFTTPLDAEVISRRFQALRRFDGPGAG